MSSRYKLNATDISTLRETMFLSVLNTATPKRPKRKPIPRRLWLLLALLIVAIFGSSCSRSHEPQQNSAGAHPKAEAPALFSAEMWLKWDKSSRMAFIMGTLRGYSDGVTAGCGDAMRAVNSLPGVKGFTPEAADEMRMDCGTRYKPSNRALESYEDAVTNFYTRYPEGRIIEIQEVLLLLASDPNLTAEDIHKRVKITSNPEH